MNEEATAGGLISLTPEIVMPEGSARRNSTGKIVSKVSNSLSSSGEKVLPHYLRASTSSCHDFCKYGRDHVFNKKGKSPAPPKFPNRKPTSGKEEDPNRLNAVRGKKPVLKLIASPKSKPKINERIKPIRKKVLAPILTMKPTESPEEIDDRASLFKETESPEDHNTIAKSGISHDSANSLEEAESFIQGSHTKEVEKETETIKQAPGQQSLPVYDNDPSKQLESSKVVELVVEKTETSEHSENTKQSRPAIRKATFAAKPKLKQEISSTVRKSVASAKLVNKQTPVSLTRKIDVPDKSAKSVKSTTKTMKPIMPSKSNSPSNPPRSVVTRNLGVASKAEGKKTLPLSRAYLSSLKPSNIKGPNIKHNCPGVSRMSPSMKNQKKGGDNNASERTLYVIEPKADDVLSGTIMSKTSSPQLHPSSMSSSSSLSMSSSVSLSLHGEEEQENSDYTYSEQSELVSEDGTGYDQVTDVNSKYRRPLRTTMVQPHKEDTAAYKLKFRRGKLVNLQAKDSGPRRLRFRKGRVLSDSQSGEGEPQRRRYRMKAERDGEDSSETNPEAKTVVLKHQDMQGKKDTQGLLNHVIEETASKLVETRKSKVKALVGAFETVISLQESKPASAV